MNKLAEINEKAGEVINALREGQPGIMEDIYDRYRADFLGWAANRFYTTPGDLEDAWQEAVVIFYKQVVSGKLKELKCSVKTYLFAVGYNWLLKNHRKMKRIWWRGEVEDVLASDPLLATLSFDDDIWEEERLLLRESMEKLSPQCRKLLTERHYDERTIQELLEAHEEYSTKNAVTVTLSTCLSRLKQIIQEKTK